jgi:hypothetical protein
MEISSGHLCFSVDNQHEFYVRGRRLCVALAGVNVENGVRHPHSWTILKPSDDLITATRQFGVEPRWRVSDWQKLRHQVQVLEAPTQPLVTTSEKPRGSRMGARSAFFVLHSLVVDNPRASTDEYIAALEKQNLKLQDSVIRTQASIARRVIALVQKRDLLNKPIFTDEEMRKLLPGEIKVVKV